MDRNLTRSQTINAWKMIYRLMDNVKVKMDDDYQARSGNVTNSDVDGDMLLIPIKLTDAILEQLRNMV